MSAAVAPPEPAAETLDTERGIDDELELELDDDGADVDLPPAARPARRRRLRIALLLLLTGAAGALLVFSGWYLLFRRPIADLLPPVISEPMPGYDYSLYGVRRPMGIAVSPDGSRIYVTQTEGGTAVVAFDNLGTELARMTPPDDGVDHVFVYVAVEPATGDVYVSDRPAGAIHVYSGAGELLRTLDGPPGLAAWQPLGVAFSADGHLLVTDAGAGQIHELDAHGALLRTIGERNQFSYPNAVVVDATGTIYVSDSNNGRLVVLDSAGRQIAVVRRGPNAGDLGMPRGLALDDRGRLYVVDTTDQSVKIYRAPGPDGAQPLFLGRFGAFGIDEGAFRFPNAVAIDARGRVYVADWSNDRVQVWTY